MSANVARSIPTYLDALGHLRDKSNINNCLVALSRQRILFVESHIYNFVLSLCLPRARSLIQCHRAHSSEAASPCPCYEGLHPHEHWLLKLVLKIDQSLAWTSNSFSLDPTLYLPKLIQATPYTRNFASNLRRMHDDAVPEQSIINTLKDVLYHWLNIPNDAKAQFRAAMVNIFHTTLGSGALMLPNVWELCQQVPRWVYSTSTGHYSKDDPLVTFGTAVKLLPAALPNTTTYHLLKLLWEKYERFCAAQNSRGKTSLKLVRNPTEFDSASLDLSDVRLHIFKNFLIDSSRFVKHTLPHSHSCFDVFQRRTDFVLPLRELAPCRVNLVRSLNSDRLRTPRGLFNLLVFRVLMYNTDAARTEDFNFDVQSIKTFRLTYDADRNSKYYYNSCAYGSNNPGRKDSNLMDLYWTLSVRLWPQFVADSEGEYIYTSFLNFIYFAANNFMSLEKQKSFTECVEWFRDTKDSEGNSFRQIGPLIRLLVAGDLAYAGIVEKPSVEEMGSLISVVSKGAVSGLNLLGLLPDKKTKHSKYPPTQVVNAFKLLFDRLKEALDPVEWSDMGLDTIVLEHSLCKLKRMKGPLGLLPNC